MPQLEFQLHELLMLAVGAQGVVIVTMMFALPLRRGWVALAQRRRTRAETLLSPLVFDALERGKPCARLRKAVTRGRRRILRDLLVRIAMSIRGDDAIQLTRLCQQIGVIADETRSLRASHAVRRAEAAANLGVLGAAASIPHLQKLLSDPDARVQVASMRALTDIAGPSVAGDIVPMLGRDDPYLVCRAQDVLVSLGTAIAPELIEFIRKGARGDAREAALDILPFAVDESSTSLLLNLMYSPDDEVRIKATKAASQIGDERFFGIFMRFAEDPRWEIRCQAVKGLGPIGNPDSVRRLRIALGDKNRHVRLNAGVALCQIGYSGVAALERAAEGPDELVRGAAAYALQVHAAGVA